MVRRTAPWRASPTGDLSDTGSLPVPTAVVLKGDGAGGVAPIPPPGAPRPPHLQGLRGARSPPRPPSRVPRWGPRSESRRMDSDPGGSPCRRARHRRRSGPGEQRVRGGPPSGRRRAAPTSPSPAAARHSRPADCDEPWCASRCAPGRNAEPRRDPRPPPPRPRVGRTSWPDCERARPRLRPDARECFACGQARGRTRKGLAGRAAAVVSMKHLIQIMQRPLLGSFVSVHHRSGGQILRDALVHHLAQRA
jgi:hypothetical protein